MTLIGNQTLILNGRKFSDFADGTIISIVAGGNLVEGLVNKDLSVSYVRNVQNIIHVITIRVKRGSNDDIFCNSLYNIWYGESIAGLKLLNGSLSQEIGDGNSNVAFENWEIENGVVASREETIMNVGGDTAQASVVYKISCQAKRTNQ